MITKIKWRDVENKVNDWENDQLVFGWYATSESPVTDQYAIIQNEVNAQIGVNQIDWWLVWEDYCEWCYKGSLVHPFEAIKRYVRKHRLK